MVGGRTRKEGRVITGVSTDSRVLRPGDVFFALLPREEAARDGHNYVADAALRGAAAAVVCRAVPEAAPELPLIEVDDSLVALGRLAAAWRRRMPARIVVITGSVGKTTTKEMLSAILCRITRTLVAERSFNNEIGVPLTLLALKRAYEFCVLEFAMRGAGEIEYLAKIAQPEVGVITNIGMSHIGRLGSLEAVAAAKGELLPCLPITGAAVLNRKDRFFDELRERTRARIISFGLHPDADVRSEQVQLHGLQGSTFALRIGAAGARVHLRVPGRHFVENALAAAAAAHALGVGVEAIAKGLSAYEGMPMRGAVIESPRGFSVISDCYNAAPASVEAALELLALSDRRRIFVFGDMAELGEEGPHAHRKVGERSAELGLALLVTVGDLARLAAETASALGVETVSVSSADEALSAVSQRVLPGDVVLVKGSRVMRLERVVEGLTADA